MFGYLAKDKNKDTNKKLWIRKQKETTDLYKMPKSHQYLVAFTPSSLLYAMDVIFYAAQASTA